MAKDKRKNIVRCEVTGRIVNGKPVIIAEKNVIMAYIRIMGYNINDMFKPELIMILALFILMPFVSAQNTPLINNPNIPLVTTTPLSVSSSFNNSTTNNYYNISNGITNFTQLLDVNFGLFGNFTTHANQILRVNPLETLLDFSSESDPVYSSGITNYYTKSESDGLYCPMIWAYNQTYTLGTYNYTYDSWSYNQTNNSIFNSTYNQWAYNQTNNSIFNSTYNQWAYNQTNNSRFNSTYNQWAYNQTNNSVFNSTYNQWAYNQTGTNLQTKGVGSNNFINITTSDGSSQYFIMVSANVNGSTAKNTLTLLQNNVQLDTRDVRQSATTDTTPVTLSSVQTIANCAGGCIFNITNSTGQVFNIQWSYMRFFAK